MKKSLLVFIFLSIATTTWAFLEAPVKETFTQANGTLAGNFTGVVNIQVVNNTFYGNETNYCNWWLDNVINSNHQIAIDIPDIGDFSSTFNTYYIEIVNGETAAGYGLGLFTLWGDTYVSLQEITGWTSNDINESNATQLIDFSNGYSFGMQYDNDTSTLILFKKSPGGSWTAIQNETISNWTENNLEIEFEANPQTTTMRFDNLSYMNYTYIPPSPPALTPHGTIFNDFYCDGELVVN